jgi:acetoin utilization protein AcuC
MSDAFFIYSPELERYHYPPSCPFKTERAGMTRRILSSMGLLTGRGIAEHPVTPAAEEDFLRYHTREYLDALKRISGGEILPSDLFLGLGTDDCPVFADIWACARWAAGGSLTAARLILEGRARVAFNPAGGLHHAVAGKAGGFCYVNDIVLACRLLADAGKKVFCLDLDVHQGNGQQEAFYRDPQVFTVSLHESGKTLYPWAGFEDEIGDGPGRGYNVNLPFPAGTDDQIYRAAFREIVPPLLHAFRPDVIVLELGMDVLSTDPLAHLRMTNNAFADLLPGLLQAGVPILATGGGGYNPEHTARSWALMWSVLSGAEPDFDPSIGMGGVFLGSSEWSAGLRDPRIYANPDDRPRLQAEVDRVTARIRKDVFPLHGIPAGPEGASQ